MKCSIILIQSIKSQSSLTTMNESDKNTDKNNLCSNFYISVISDFERRY